MRGLVAALVAAAVIVPATAASSGAPSLRISRANDAFAVVGTNFQAREIVKVTVSSLGLHTRKIVANRGSFLADFGSLRLARCGPLKIWAIGSLGSHASFVLPGPACLDPTGSTH